MKKQIITTLAIFIIASMNFVQAQTLDNILEKHFKTVGQDKLANAKTYYLKAELSQMGMVLPMEMRMKRPDKFRVEMEMQGQKMIQAYDGVNGWMVAPWISPEPQVLEGSQLNEAMKQADLEGELYKFKEKGHAVEFVGKVSIDGKETYKIKLTNKDGSIKDYFIDASTDLIVKVKTKLSAQGQEVDIEQNLSEYKDFDGFKMATKMLSTTPMGDVSLTIVEFKLNESFDEAMFKQPGK
ncbi:MAG: hypothetical protein KAH68_05005 [Draconibacterium sp.]|nr:hypothetical protein [Draconibacterium sp.]